MSRIRTRLAAMSLGLLLTLVGSTVAHPPGPALLVGATLSQPPPKGCLCTTHVTMYTGWHNYNAMAAWDGNCACWTWTGDVDVTWSCDNDNANSPTCCICSRATLEWANFGGWSYVNHSDAQVGKACGSGPWTSTFTTILTNLTRATEYRVRHDLFISSCADETPYDWDYAYFSTPSDPPGM